MLGVLRSRYSQAIALLKQKNVDTSAGLTLADQKGLMSHHGQLYLLPQDAEKFCRAAMTSVAGMIKSLPTLSTVAHDSPSSHPAIRAATQLLQEPEVASAVRSVMRRKQIGAVTAMIENMGISDNQQGGEEGSVSELASTLHEVMNGGDLEDPGEHVQGMKRLRG